MKPCKQCGWPFEVGTHDGLCPNCRKLQANPDALSKRTTLGGIPFKDLKQLDESERITQIVAFLKAWPGKNIAIVVDCGEGYSDKGDRYIKAVREKLPGVKLISRSPGPVKDGEMITFRNAP